MKKIFFGLLLSMVLFMPMLPAIAQDVEGPRYGGTLVAALPDDPPTLAVWLSSSFLVRMVGPQIMEGLLDQEPDLTPKPLLAESWTVSPDGLTWTFRIRRGVKWHDGKPLTADDVVFSVNEVWLKHLSDAATRWKLFGLKAEKVDNYTVVFKLEKRNVYATHYWDSHFGPIIPKHLFEGTDIEKNPYNLKPVGTGPFRFKEYVKGSHIIFEKNPDYWQKDKQGNRLPYLDRLVFRIMPDATSRLMAMEKREVDYQSYPGFPVESAQKLKELGFKIGADPVSGLARIQRIHMNQRKPPLSSLNVRKALLHAMDRTEILQKAAYGFGVVSIGPLHQQSPAYKDFINHDVPKYEYNPEKANRLLDEAGFKRGSDGIRFKLTITINRGLSQDATVAELLRDHFQKVGIQLEIQKVDEATRLTLAAKRQFDLTMWGPSISGPSPEAVRNYWHSSLVDTPGGFLNPSGINDKEIDGFTENVGSIQDPAKRNQLCKDFQRRMVENVYELWLYDALIVSAWNPDYVGLPQKVWGHYDALSNVWWKKGKLIK
jgi:peptide/nickel transport system substrate-binding protein